MLSIVEEEKEVRLPAVKEKQLYIEDVGEVFDSSEPSSWAREDSARQVTSRGPSGNNPQIIQEEPWKEEDDPKDEKGKQLSQAKPESVKLVEPPLKENTSEQLENHADVVAVSELQSEHHSQRKDPNSRLENHEEGINEELEAQEQKEQNNISREDSNAPS